MLAILVYLSLVAACVVVGMTYGRWSVGSCCGCGCGTLATDNFNRAAIGTDWTTVAGSWSLSSNKLRTSSSAALITYGTAAPGVDTIVTVKATGSANDDRVRIILAYTDTNNYLYAEMEFRAAGGRLWLFSRSGGTDTQEAFADLSLESLAITGVETTLSACYSGSVFRANVDSVYAMDVNVPGFSGTTYGLGTGVLTGNADFDDFTATSTYATKAACPRCGCYCELCSGDTEQQPCELEVVTTGIANGACGSCTSLNTTYVLRRTNNVSGCNWTVTLGGTCEYVEMRASYAGARNMNVLLTNNLTFGDAESIEWDTIVAPLDCSTWDGVSLSYLSGLGTQCDGTSSTASVSVESL